MGFIGLCGWKVKPSTLPNNFGMGVEGREGGWKGGREGGREGGRGALPADAAGNTAAAVALQVASDAAGVTAAGGRASCCFAKRARRPCLWRGR